MSDSAKRREFNKLLTELLGDNSLKAWSLIITFFGDAVVARGGNVSAKTVQSVLTEAGVGAGAVRTAFSRLAGDQWITRQKIGRESFYELGENGYLPFKAATVRIYSPLGCESNKSSDWSVAIKNPGVKGVDNPVLKNGMQITSNCWLFSDGHGVSSLSQASFLVLSGELSEFPKWVTEKILPDETSQGYVQLQKRFSAIKQVEALSPLECMVTRCLLIHQWRRLLLRTPILPNELVPEGWPEKGCREFVANLYHQLLPGSEAWLDENGTCADGSLPSAGIDLSVRFTQRFATAIKTKPDVIRTGQ